MWSKIVEYLKDACLVARIQKAFGVETHYGNSIKGCLHSETRDATSRKSDSNNCPSNRGEIRENGYATNERNSVVTKSVKNPSYTISNYFWYYLFLFGTELGDEIFYCTFIPFWFWNIDGAVGRRIFFVWSIVMAMGQMLKDVMCWPRPACPPVVRLQSKWSEEYGMPSTHAMMAISIPFSVVLFTMNRYIYPVSIGWTIAFLWCTLVCMSRLYLGMHTVLDIIAGVMLAIALMIPLVPLVDMIDYYLFTNLWSVTAFIATTIGIIVYYPCSKKWTPTRGDTAMVLSVVAGIYLGTWFNYNAGKMMASTISPPYNISWPSYAILGRLIVRIFIGLCSIIAIRSVCKFLSYEIMCAMLRVNAKDLMKSRNYSGDKNKNLVDLVHKYLTCFMIGYNTVYLMPHAFAMMGIDRPTFYIDM